MGYNLPGMAASFDNTLTGRRKVPTPPRLTQEQRRAAYEKALKLRRERRDLKQWMSDSTMPATNWGKLNTAFGKDAAQGMKVYDLLTALPGIGRAKALALLEQAGFKHPEKTTVRATGPRQREKLFELLSKSVQLS